MEVQVVESCSASYGENRVMELHCRYGLVTCTGFQRITTEEKTPQNPSEVQEHTWTSPHVPASQRTLKMPCETANHPHVSSNKHTPHPTCANTPKIVIKVVLRLANLSIYSNVESSDFEREKMKK
jgi:hypothetical protein